MIKYTLKNRIKTERRRRALKAIEKSRKYAPKHGVPECRLSSSVASES